jgi:hypothetical protein
MPVFKDFRVNAVQPQIVSFPEHGVGHGFNITNQYGSPLFTIIYPTVHEAQAARNAIDAALANATAIATPGP